MEKVKNDRMEVRVKWKYAMALLGFSRLRYFWVFRKFGGF